MSTEKNEIKFSVNGMGFGGMLTLIFITLKLLNIIKWSWIWVLSPIWITFALSLTIFIFSILIIVIYSYIDVKRGN